VQSWAASTQPLAREPSRGALAFDERPILVFWETTKACLLSCRHCRATALPEAMPGELSTAEASQLLQQVAGFGKPNPIVILTGGDCLMRTDLLELTTHARQLGLTVALSPSVTPRLTPQTLAPFLDLGVRVVSISLDGSTAATHDRVRGIAGHFDATITALTWMRQAGIKVQVNTTVMRDNVEELADVAALMQRLDIPIWEVFFLVNVGRGTAVSAPTAAENEDVCHFLFEASRYGFLVRTVEAPFFRRVATWRRELAEIEDPAEYFDLGPLYTHLHRRLGQLLGEPTRRPMAQSVATRDGMGIIFVAHDGSVRPSGFLPLSLGNVKDRSLAEIYREDPVLRAIRAADFAGRCGVCPFRSICGGSRARAFASTDDPLGEDPGCVFGAA
jgi:radical SAM protein